MIRILEDLHLVNESDKVIFRLQKDKQGYRLFVSEKSKYFNKFQQEDKSDKDYKEFATEADADEFVNEFGKKYNVDTTIETH